MEHSGHYVVRQQTHDLLSFVLPHIVYSSYQELRIHKPLHPENVKELQLQYTDTGDSVPLGHTYHVFFRDEESQSWFTQVYQFAIEVITITEIVSFFFIGP